MAYFILYAYFKLSNTELKCKKKKMLAAIHLEQVSASITKAKTCRVICTIQAGLISLCTSGLLWTAERFPAVTLLWPEKLQVHTSLGRALEAAGLLLVVGDCGIQFAGQTSPWHGYRVSSHYSGPLVLRCMKPLGPLRKWLLSVIPGFPNSSP